MGPGKCVRRLSSRFLLLLPSKPQSTPPTCPSSPQTYEMFSWLLQPLPGPHTQLLGHLGTLAAFAIQQVQRHQGSLDASGPARDIVDAFRLKMAKVGEG